MARYPRTWHGLLAVWVTMALLGASAAVAQDAAETTSTVYVPFQDLAAAIDPAAKTVLMNRQDFLDLLAAAQANHADANQVRLGQVTTAHYQATVVDQQLRLTGALTVVSLSDDPVAVDFRFGQVGLESVTLDGQPAALGYNAQGKLSLIVSGAGEHQVDIVASAMLTELSVEQHPAGGFQFSVLTPQAVSAVMDLTAPGDLDITATAPTSKPHYESATDTTHATMALGGRDAVTVLLLGNGRQEDQQAILLGESVADVQLGRTHQTLGCFYTVNILRRSVRELQFLLDAKWIVTEVTCPNLVRWSTAPAADQPDRQVLTVRLQTPTRGAQSLHFKATADQSGDRTWRSPHVSLVDATFQRGYLLLDAREYLRVRRHTLHNARQEDLHLARSPALRALSAGRLYYHWGSQWSVEAETAEVALQRDCNAQQTIQVSDKGLTLVSEFEISAVGRDMFDLTFDLPGSNSHWDLANLTVNNTSEGFEYRLLDHGQARTLRIDLARPIPPEAAVNVTITLRHVPKEWEWSADAEPKNVLAPLIRSHADSVRGIVAVVGLGDLDVAAVSVAPHLEAVTVGRMTPMGLGRNVQLAWSYETATDTGALALNVSRRRARLTASAIGLASVRPNGLRSHWRLSYTISRARTRMLAFLADKSLGDEIDIHAHGHAVVSRNRSSFDDAYDLWSLELDGPAAGVVHIDVRYDRPLPDGPFALPLVRPHNVSSVSEMVAIEGGEELDVAVAVEAARAVDAVDLPALPTAATRILSAWRLEAEANPIIELTTTIHQTYALPTAIGTSAEFTTYLGPAGSQRTEATFSIVNAGIQFLEFRLPESAELWSVQVADKPAKLQRSAGGNLMVALPQSTPQVTVRVVYQAPGGDTDHLQLARAELINLKVNQLTWHVMTPTDYRITGQQSHLVADGIFVEPAAAQHILDALQDTFESASEGMVLAKQSMASEYDQVRESGDDLEIQEATATPEARGPEPPAPPQDQAMFESGAAGRLNQLGYTGMPVRGRYSLPVELTPPSDIGHTVTFTTMSQDDLVVTMSDHRINGRLAALAFALAGAIGLMCLRTRRSAKATLILAMLILSAVLGIWWPGARAFLNGIFYAGLALIPLYAVIGLARRIVTRRSPKGAAATLVIACLLTAPALGQDAATPPPAAPPVVVPYEGDPTGAADAQKVIIPYDTFARLWNQVHPDQPIELPDTQKLFSLAGTRYDVTVREDKLHLTLSTYIRTSGAGHVSVPMNFSGLAVTSAELDGKPVNLSNGEHGIVLVLPAGTEGDLRVTALTTVQLESGRPTVKLLLPPLPAAVMRVHLPDPDLLLEADGVEGALHRADDGDWTVPLGMTNALRLRWAPKPGGGTTDRTLAAAAEHDVAFHQWGLVGETQLTFSYSASDYDRFSLLLPADYHLTDISGANLRDSQTVGDRTIDGKSYRVVQVRLHRPATKSYTLIVKWLAPLPELDQPFVLDVPRAADVGRESGTAQIYATGGIDVTELTVTGGRRLNASAPDPQGRGASHATDLAQPVASYYWPYRPFELTLKLGRADATTTAQLSQLIRLDAHRCQLLVQADLTATQGRLFSADFALPDGYELVSALGGDVEDYFVQPTPTGQALHVNLRSGVTATRLALVLLRRPVTLGRFTIPQVTATDPGGRPLPKQTGRLAVQVSASLAAHTLSSENLTSQPPARALAGWLDSAGIRAVQFAYHYERPETSLVLNVGAKPTKTRLDVLTGVTIQPMGAWITYRLRYTISGSPVDRVSFTLPAEMAPQVTVSSHAQRNVVVTDSGDGRKRWTVLLVNEITGVMDVAVNVAVPIGSETTSLPIPTPRVDRVDEQQTVVAVQNLSRHGVSIGESTELTAMPASQQQQYVKADLQSALQFMFQSFRDDWSLVLAIEPSQEAKRAAAVVDLMAIHTVIDRAGNSRYLIDLMIQNRSEQFLRLAVPKALTLWSAYVDGQPVRPVVPTDGDDSGEVLIPLVRTSPWGLPYRVKLYLAGQITDPLGSVTQIELPSVAIKNIDVIETTWTLILPDGYRYARAGGNMDQAYNEVLGQAERLAAELKALTSQAERFSVSNKSWGSYGKKGRRVSGRNWSELNDRQQVAKEKLEHYVRGNRDKLGDADKRRLDRTISDVTETQKKLDLSWRTQQQQWERTAKDNLGQFLNDSAVNPGLAEHQRDSQLDGELGFVSQANAAQQQAISGELQRGADEMRDMLDESSEEGRAAEGDRADAVVQKLEEKARTKNQYRQEMLAKKLEQLQDNRMARGKLAQQQQRGDQGGNQMADNQGVTPDMPQMIALDGSGAGGPAGGFYGAGGRSAGGNAESVDDDGLVAGLPSEAAVEIPLATGQAFSLPVSLPHLPVVRDFSSPGGQPKLTIWAIREEVVAPFEQTAAVLVILAVGVMVRWTWLNLRRKARPIPRAHRIVVYAVLAAALCGLSSIVMALVLAGALAGVVELSRYMPRAKASPA